MTKTRPEARTSQTPAQHVDAQQAAPRRRGRRPARNRPPGHDAKARERALRALALRIAGCTYRQIAGQLAVNERTAYYDVQNELGALDPVIGKTAERLRDLEAARLDRLWLALNPGITAGQPGAILAAVRVMARRAKLFGLDAPTTIAGPNGDAVPIRIVYQQLPE
jgi:hypothetical protein